MCDEAAVIACEQLSMVTHRVLCQRWIRKFLSVLGMYYIQLVVDKYMCFKHSTTLTSGEDTRFLVSSLLDWGGSPPCTVLHYPNFLSFFSGKHMCFTNGTGNCRPWSGFRINNKEQIAFKRVQWTPFLGQTRRFPFNVVAQYNSMANNSRGSATSITQRKQ